MLKVWSTLIAVTAEASGPASGPSLVCVADWGGKNESKPATGDQIIAAHGMAQVALDLSADRILLLGDNFYSHGVDSVDSKRFQETFENVYTPELFGNLPFWAIAGNHDYLGSMQAQLDYAAKSPHWNFPSLYYSMEWNWTAFSGESRSAQILMIDTVDLAGPAEDHSGLPAGPQNDTCAATQWSWIKRQLEASTADFLWVAGHYPIYSAGDDGTVDVLVDKLLPMLKEHGAHYICGHDHFAQHLNMDGVHQFQNGMGMECCYGVENLDTVPDGYIKYLISGKHAQGFHVGTGDEPPSTVLGGFNTMVFSDNHVTITTHREDGSELYSARVPHRRSMLEIV